MNWFDRFCYKYNRFGIKNLIIYIIAISAVVYVASLTNAGATVLSWLVFSRDAILQGQVWRIFSFVFIPTQSNPIYFILFLYLYYMIGGVLEREWGALKFTIYYFFSVLLTAAVYFIFDIGGFWGNATYINLSLFFAFATLFPDFQMLLFFFIPIKIKYLAMLNGVFFLFNIITTPFPFNLGPAVAILAYILFFIPTFADMFRRGRYRFSKKTIDFRRTVKKAKQTRGYIHKCHKCNVTDADRPDMEFRYCSLCSGYYCYCADHIFDHEHE